MTITVRKKITNGVQDGHFMQEVQEAQWKYEMFEDLTLAKIKSQDSSNRSRSLKFKISYQTADSTDQKIAEKAWKLRLGLVGTQQLPVKRKIDFASEDLDASMPSLGGDDGAMKSMTNALL